MLRQAEHQFGAASAVHVDADGGAHVEDELRIQLLWARVLGGNLVVQFEVVKVLGVEQLQVAADPARGGVDDLLRHGGGYAVLCEELAEAAGRVGPGVGGAELQQAAGAEVAVQAAGQRRHRNADAVKVQALLAHALFGGLFKQVAGVGVAGAQ
ncbi:hypothetical protein [Corynebacterium ureicelerivorans]|uniref:Uncharacterized protein n=1 Tax=Corynebacterium ureicelerivorans TaxID=401472 RepID=A0A077HRL9_9CORY|nr:hypothetical protein [Corynebacterium ureicelerivorans]AIL97317.1 hypothetical protein CUREI_08455 [Corynebacterium ureicelerivorans]